MKYKVNFIIKIMKLTYFYIYEITTVSIDGNILQLFLNKLFFVKFNGVYHFFISNRL